MNTYGRGPVPWEGTISRVRKNGYVPLGTYQKNNLENFGGGPVQNSKKISYSNFLGRTSQKSHPVVTVVIVTVAIVTVAIVTVVIAIVVIGTVVIVIVVIVIVKTTLTY